MERSGIVLLAFVFFLIIVDCFGAEPEVNTTDSNVKFDKKSQLSSNDTSSSVVKTSGSDPVLGSAKTDQEKKGEGRDGGLQGGISNDLGNSSLSKQLDSKQGSKTGTDKNDSSKGSEVKGVDKKGKSSEVSESVIKVPEKRTKDGASDSLKPSRKETSRGEECDSSNWCTANNKKLIACLRVPGNESPELSLLIQNKGNGLLTVHISAPDFVHLEKTTVQVQEKDGEKVIVSVGNGGDNTSIILTSVDGSCTLDFRSLLLHNSENKIDYSPSSTYTKFLMQAPSIVYMSAAILLLMVSAWMCVRFRRRHLPREGSRYQKLETELPVSDGMKTDFDTTDGWDNSWGDNWDDEEAPKTPSHPITPSLSSKGLASRRLSKEGWKD